MSKMKIQKYSHGSFRIYNDHMFLSCYIVLRHFTVIYGDMNSESIRVEGRVHGGSR